MGSYPPRRTQVRVLFPLQKTPYTASIWGFSFLGDSLRRPKDCIDFNYLELDRIGCNNKIAGHFDSQVRLPHEKYSIPFWANWMLMWKFCSMIAKQSIGSSFMGVLNYALIKMYCSNRLEIAKILPTHHINLDNPIIKNEVGLIGLQNPPPLQHLT